eukprot:Platyproteum_vivax@DN2821_c0_g1_i1.p1
MGIAEEEKQACEKTLAEKEAELHKCVAEHEKCSAVINEKTAEAKNDINQNKPKSLFLEKEYEDVMKACLGCNLHCSRVDELLKGQCTSMEFYWRDTKKLENDLYVKKLFEECKKNAGVKDTCTKSSGPIETVKNSCEKCLQCEQYKKECDEKIASVEEAHRRCHALYSDCQNGTKCRECAQACKGVDDVTGPQCEAMEQQQAQAEAPIVAAAVAPVAAAPAMLAPPMPQPPMVAYQQPIQQVPMPVVGMIEGCGMSDEQVPELGDGYQFTCGELDTMIKDAATKLASRPRCSELHHEQSELREVAFGRRKPITCQGESEKSCALVIPLTKGPQTSGGLWAFKNF